MWLKSIVVKIAKRYWKTKYRHERNHSFSFSCHINWSVKLMSHLFDAINMMMKSNIDNEKDMLCLNCFDIVLDDFFLLLFLLQYILLHFLSSRSLDISMWRSVRNSISLNWYHQTLFLWRKWNRSLKPTLNTSQE